MGVVENASASMQRMTIDSTAIPATMMNATRDGAKLTPATARRDNDTPPSEKPADDCHERRCPAGLRPRWNAELAEVADAMTLGSIGNCSPLRTLISGGGEA